MNRSTFLVLLPLFEAIDKGSASAILRDADGNAIAAQPSPEPDAPKRQPSFGTMGDPHEFTCVSARKLDGYATKGSDILRAEVGTVTFSVMVPGSSVAIPMKARVIRHQTSTVNDNGKLIGKGRLELTFGQAFARSEPAIVIPEQAAQWRDDVLNQWKAYRDANRYPVPLLVAKSASTGGAAVED